MIRKAQDLLSYERMYYAQMCQIGEKADVPDNHG